MKIIKITSSWNPLYKRIFLEATEDKRCVWDFPTGTHSFSLKRGDHIDIFMRRSEFNRVYPVVGETLNFAQVALLDFRRTMSDSQIPSELLHKRENTLF